MIAPKPARKLTHQLRPLKDVRVWRFALHYFFAFGAFVALALWLPRYLIGVYGFDIKTAGMIGAMYSIPASIFRAYTAVCCRTGSGLARYCIGPSRFRRLQPSS